MAITPKITRREDGGWDFTWPAPVPPHDVVATAVSETEIDVAWSAAPNATSYEILRGPHGGPYVSIGSTEATSVADEGLASGTAYYYVVRTVTANGTSANSTEATATTEGDAEEAHTTDYEVQPGDDGKILTNAGATFGVTFSLPGSLPIGFQITFRERAPAASEGLNASIVGTGGMFTIGASSVSGKDVGATSDQVDGSELEIVCTATKTWEAVGTPVGVWTLA